jgi:hypothetical protein
MLDLLKKKGLHMIISVILCLILKLFLILNKLGVKDRTKTEILIIHRTTRKHFVICTSCLKSKNNLLSIKHHTTQNLVNTLNVCLMLFCLILSYVVFSSIYILQIKRTQRIMLAYTLKTSIK